MGGIKGAQVALGSAPFRFSENLMLTTVGIESGPQLMFFSFLTEGRQEDKGPLSFRLSMQWH